MTVYKRLQQKLSLHPAGAPATETFDKILRILFSEEDAAIAAELNFVLIPLDAIVERTGKAPDSVYQALEAMADRALVYAKKDKQGNPRYSLLPTIPGLFEFPFMRIKDIALRDQLGHLWHKYHEEALGNEFAGSPTPQMRVIPVRRSLSLTTEILPYESVSNMIDRARYIALADCACRVSMRNCDKPIEVCLAFGSNAEFLVERGRARHITAQEAVEVLDRAEEAGLVHTCNNSQDEFAVVCNCCSCCCTVLRGLTQLKNPNAFARSGFVIDYQPEECVGCMACIEDRCPVAAIVDEGEVVAVDAGLCIGCGLCVSVCPSEALQMTRREESHVTPSSGRELMGSVLMEKGRLEAFVKMNRS